MSGCPCVCGCFYFWIFGYLQFQICQMSLILLLGCKDQQFRLCYVIVYRLSQQLSVSFYPLRSYELCKGSKKIIKTEKVLLILFAIFTYFNTALHKKTNPEYVKVFHSYGFLSKKLNRLKKQ